METFLSAFFSLFTLKKEILRQSGITASITIHELRGKHACSSVISLLHLQIPPLLPWHLLMVHFLPPLFSCPPQLLSPSSPQTSFAILPSLPFSFLIFPSSLTGPRLVLNCFFIYIPSPYYICSPLLTEVTVLPQSSFTV